MEALNRADVQECTEDKSSRACSAASFTKSLTAELAWWLGRWRLGAGLSSLSQ